jgi:WXG100 family type VII secretion target
VTSGVAQTQSDSAVMAQTAAKFDHVNESLQSMLSTLMTELSTLNSTWRGLGATAFEQVRAQYEADLKSLNQALADTAESIRASGVGYHTTDTDAASRLSSTGGNFSLPL